MKESVDVRMAMESLVKKPTGATGLWGLSALSSLLSMVLLASSIMFVGCAIFRRGGDSDIKDATQAIEAARDDGQRARAYSSRGTAYTEKARSDRFSANREYQRLFDLAIEDHNRAIALNPGNAEVYFHRGEAYYDRGSLDVVDEKEKAGKIWFGLAAADFERVTEMDPKNSRAFDMLGVTYQSNGEVDKAIRAYTQEMALDARLGKLRLTGAYCNLGDRHYQEKDFAAAIAAYQKSTEFGSADDKTCPSGPFEQMARIYTLETRQYDKAWEMVHQAQKAGLWIEPELIGRLKKDSGRTN